MGGNNPPPPSSQRHHDLIDAIRKILGRTKEAEQLIKRETSRQKFEEDDQYFEQKKEQRQ